MMDSVGGFYAELKLKVDSASFNNGIGVLKQFKNEIQGITNIQRVLNRLYNDANGPSGSSSKQRITDAVKAEKLKHLAMEQQVKDMLKLRILMAKDRDDRKKDAIALAQGIDMPFKIMRSSLSAALTSVKWLVGGMVAAIGVATALGKAMGDNWRSTQGTTQTARGLGVSSSWLSGWGKAEAYAGAGAGTVSSALGGIQAMLANPEIGQQNPGLITAISGVLGMKTSDPKLAFQALNKMSGEGQFNVVMSALQKMWGSGNQNDRVNAQTIAGMLSPDLAKLLQVKGGFQAAFKMGSSATLTNDSDMAKSERASLAVSEAMARLGGAWDLFAANMAGELIGYLDKFNTWFASNGPLIKKTLAEFSSFLGQTVGYISDLVNDPIGTIGKSVSGISKAGDDWVATTNRGFDEQRLMFWNKDNAPGPISGQQYGPNGRGELIVTVKTEPGVTATVEQRRMSQAYFGQQIGGSEQVTRTR